MTKIAHTHAEYKQTTRQPGKHINILHSQQLTTQIKRMPSKLNAVKPHRCYTTVVPCTDWNPGFPEPRVSGKPGCFANPETRVWGAFNPGFRV